MLELLAETRELLRRLVRQHPNRATTMRLMQGADALLPIGTAAELLGGKGKREWIEEHVQIRYVDGDRRVRWGDVLEATEAYSAANDEGWRPAAPATLVRAGIKRR